MTPKLLQYVNDHSDPEPDDLYRLMRASNIHLINGRMCSGHLQGRLLKMLVAMIKPKRILELGTFSGYSALCMAEGSAPDTVVDTVEVDDELEDFITDALSKSPYGAKVRLHIADALEFTKSCEPASYDLIFIISVIIGTFPAGTVQESRIIILVHVYHAFVHIIFLIVYIIPAGITTVSIRHI